MRVTTEVGNYTFKDLTNPEVEITFNVQLLDNSSGNPMPYISYWGANMPKIAWLNAASASSGTVNDMFNGNWEVSYIPTSSKIDDLDTKKDMKILTSKEMICAIKAYDIDLITLFNSTPLPFCSNIYFRIYRISFTLFPRMNSIQNYKLLYCKGFCLEVPAL